jgi:hypothetical protein
MKMENMECSETSAYKIQTPGNYPEENIQQVIELCCGLSSHKTHVSHWWAERVWSCSPSRHLLNSVVWTWPAETKIKPSKQNSSIMNGLVRRGEGSNKFLAENRAFPDIWSNNKVKCSSLFCNPRQSGGRILTSYYLPSDCICISIPNSPI